MRNIVQRSAVKMGSEQGFGVDEKVAHHGGPAGHCRFDITGRPLGKPLLRTPPIGLHTQDTAWYRN